MRLSYSSAEPTPLGGQKHQWVAADDETVQVEPNVKLSSGAVQIHFRDRWWTLDMLDFKAREYLRHHDNEFGQRDYAVKLRLDCEDNKQYVRLFYYGSVGQPYWEVSFDRNAHISSHKRASSGEEY